MLLWCDISITQINRACRTFVSVYFSIFFQLDQCSYQHQVIKDVLKQSMEKRNSLLLGGTLTF